MSSNLATAPDFSYSTTVAPSLREDRQSQRPFQSLLSGPDAFYNQPDYKTKTQREFSSNSLLPVTYRWNTGNKIIRVAKQIFSIILFPVGLYNLLHSAIGFAALPAATYPKKNITAIRDGEISTILQSNIAFKYKRLTIEVDGYKIDATIMGKTSTLSNGRWVVNSGGNGEIYESKLRNYTFLKILTETRSNAIVFNYPSVGSSSGILPNRQAMEKAYRAILSFLEDKEKGIGAKEIIGYGHSIGGGIQGDSLVNHKLKEDVKYLFIKSKTFSDLSTEVKYLICRPFGFLIKIFGWNISSVNSSCKLQAPEIILQSANVAEYTELQDSSKVISDGIIPKEASLAKALLDNPDCPRANKLFIGVGESHNAQMSNPSYLARKINDCLSQNNVSKIRSFLGNVLSGVSNFVCSTFFGKHSSRTN